MAIENLPRTIWWEDDRVRLVDQSKLPLVGDILESETHGGVIWAITTMAVRGAPALGVAAALGIAAWAWNESGEIDDKALFLGELDQVAEKLAQTRPTAVNLRWGAERMRKLAHDNAELPLDELRELIVQEAQNVAAEDEERNRLIGKNGAELLGEESRILTHCNAGSLATSYFGTALGVVFAAHEQGKIAHVWVDETRPLLQGARLTAWELSMVGIPHALITDNMAAYVMGEGAVDAVIVGADRIAANGDTANKIGTYGLAVLAEAHGIPFYVAAPTSSIDLTVKKGKDIPIEERNFEEVTGVSWCATVDEPGEQTKAALGSLTEQGAYEFGMSRGHRLVVSRKGEGFQFEGYARTAPSGAAAANPAFDVTPARLVTAFITEVGVIRPKEKADGTRDYAKALAKAAKGSGAIHELSGT